MNNREEQLARIKLQIAKAVSEIEHGDQAAALLALVDAFKIREELYEADLRQAVEIIKNSELRGSYERGIAKQMPIVVGPGEGDHPRVSEVKEAQPTRLTASPEPTRIKGKRQF